MPKDLGQFSDGELLARVQLMSGTVTASPVDFGLSVEEAAELGNELQVYTLALNEWNIIQDQYDSKFQAKKAAREALIAKVRAQTKLIKAQPNVTAAQLEAAGIDAPDTVKTASPSPTSAPIGWVDYGKLKHTIYFRDSMTPDSEAKPKGMLGCEIFRSIGNSPPASESDFAYVATDTASPYTTFYQMADAGKTAYFLLRWKSKNGDVGEWSDVIQATING